jgi:DivIVA domain-containing protein
MPFAPHEIENKRFVVALRGYQSDEVEGFLRTVAADYRALLEEATGSRETGNMIAEIERVMRAAREDAEREAAEIVAAARREASELRASTDQEIEACFDEISRQAARLRDLETALWHRMQALERSIADAKHELTRVAELYPMAPIESVGGARLSPVYPGGETTAFETNTELATAAL